MTRSPSSFRPQYLLIVSAAWLACGGEGNVRLDATAAGGTSGNSGSAGRGGGSGAVTDGPPSFFADRPPDISPDTPPPDAAPKPDAAVPHDTSPPPDAAVPRDTAPPPPTPDGAVSPDTQPRDTAPPPPPTPDTAPPPPPTPDAAPPDPNAIVVSECSEIPCQELFTMAASCATDGQACVSQITSMDTSTKINYCHVNGVIKRLTLTDDGTNYKNVLRAFNANGTACYTLEMTGAITGDLETQVWKSPAGVTLLTGTWSKSLDRLLLQCMGQQYDTRMVGCPGLDGDPGTTQCPAGVCPD